jgi:isoaspartyl peptidase/L-asparaginase-like protein (Ntn-hydrolase superfamily)/ketosteroid isomerase-like protein
MIIGEQPTLSIPMRLLFITTLFFAIMSRIEVSLAGEPKPQWAIVIHGGAGGDPAEWDEQEVTARQAGLQAALATGRDLLAAGGSALDAVEAVIRVLEDDANFNAGRGAVTTEDGNVELDASIMDGSNLRCGAIAGVTRPKNPISLARRVMSATKHVLLVGKGADEFAEEQQVPLVEPSYFLSRDAQESKHPERPHFGTVGCVALDAHGNLAAGTSTGGTAKKLPGRVGDSPIVGAGTYAANDSCAVSGTGIGEEYIRHSVAYDIAAQMRYAGQSLSAAVDKNMRQTLQPGVGGLIAVSRSGEIVMQHNTPGMSCGAADSHGRFETHLAIINGGAPQRSSREEITALIQQQAHDWNAGSIDRFMSLYWQSEELTFASGGEVTRGYAATLDRYKKRYPNAQAMGKLTLADLEFLPLGPGAMQVLGTWALQRDADPISGGFTLVFRHFDDGWKIVHDHTSKK